MFFIVVVYLANSQVSVYRTIGPLFLGDFLKSFHNGIQYTMFFSYMLFILKWGLFPTLIVFDLQWGRGSEPKTLPAPESVELSDNRSWVCFLFQIGIVPDHHNVCPAVRSGQRACHIPGPEIFSDDGSWVCSRVIEFIF